MCVAGAGGGAYVNASLCGKSIFLEFLKLLRKKILSKCARKKLFTKPIKMLLVLIEIENKNEEAVLLFVWFEDG